MRKIKCPHCQHTRRPYGLPKEDVEGHVYQIPCPKCGAIIMFEMGPVPELAPVDIRKAWCKDVGEAELVDEPKTYTSTPKRSGVVVAMKAPATKTKKGK